MNEQIFADGLGSISVIGGTVRLDLVSFSPSEKDANGQPKAIVQHRLVMTIPGFLHSAGKIQEAVEAISKLGANTVVQGAGVIADNTTHVSDETNPTSPVSTNKVSKPPFP